MDKSAADKKEMLSKQIAYMIRIDSIPEPSIKDYVYKAIEQCDADEISSLIDNIYNTKEAIQNKIEFLLKEYQSKTFQSWTDTSRIAARPHYRFSDKIVFTNKELLGVEKGLYAKEENVQNDFEK